MSQKKIFLIDDEPEIIKFVEKVLVKNGYSVSSSTKPNDALEAVARDNYDVLITDLKMPEMSGAELLEKVKAARPSVEVIVVTANATVNTAVDCLKKGASDYIIKPFEIKEILATIERAIKMSELKSRLVSLEEMDKLKDEFIATITHEMKTPLMAISGAVELLSMESHASDDRRHSDRRQSDKDTKNFLEIIKRQTFKMKSLVEDILDFARLEANRSVVRKEKLSLAVVAEESIKEIQSLAELKKIAVTLRPGDVMAPCDYTMIKSLMTNLISNAIKYTPECGSIAVGIAPASDSASAEVSVSDNGIGIAPEHTDKIFDKFFRVDQSMRREAGGFGLGLAICRKIVDLHGGKIWAKSPGVGQGTTVTFTLPL